MAISIFDLFKIGIGPSSSHTVGPMVAAKTFLDGLEKKGNLGAVASISVDLYGSLGATGKGHGSGKAVLLGLMGEKPDEVDVDKVPAIFNQILESKKIKLGGSKEIDFDYEVDITFHRKRSLPFHANGMMLTACDTHDEILLEKIYYSVGGGFVVDDSERDQATSPIKQNDTVLPYSFTTGDELLALCKKEKLSISEIMLRNECVWLPEAEVREKLLKIWKVMQECVEAGCKNTGILPGGLKVKRRAAELCHSLENKLTNEQYNQGSMDWVNLFALAVNEENAAGGRVVTAPTNGAAGIIPALIHYYVHFCRAYKRDGEDGIIRFLLTAAAIGIIIKENASISGAEVGCQGEIGSACAMAAAGLTEVLGGTPEQIENAAEIGIEHNLGLTCDPIGGLVQVPCIERNAMGSVKAINASRMSLRGTGEHFVSFDKAVATMRETGKDMRSKYKETSRGGLAIQVIEVPVNIVEC
ncbi:L-serine ammonia-lyase [uncultured Cocleimonas sp.]|uniref:L-serine ammonia-lyase n=1 Tax=uncultured Cocleimonas sp. TaxID=1051587 RepID=UPI002626A64F|nr:L-serine ammonia-lyase [uncultured Cocleimonas sp.]